MNHKKVFNVFVLFSVLLCGVSYAAGGDMETDDTFFQQFVVRGGRIVYYILIPMSIITLYRIIELCFLVRRRRLLPDNMANDIATIARQFGIDKMPEKLVGLKDLVSQSIYRAILENKQGSSDRKHLQHVAIEGLHDQAMRLLRKTELCNIIGNVAPMVGLFGTVYGMIQAFRILGVSSGQPEPDLLAEKISIALVTTFWGLLIAIPSLTFHGIFRTRIESIVSEAAIEVESLLYQLLRQIKGHQQNNNTTSQSRKQDQKRK